MTASWGCAAGEGDGGFDSAASLGASSTPSVADTGDDSGNASGEDEDDSIGTFGGQTGEDDGSGEGPTNPDEACNGLDDDGNGLVDDGLGTLTCGVGVCSNSTPACSNGVPGVCTPLPPAVEVCNGLDDNCDGAVDENLSGTCTSACGEGPETCVAGILECDAPQPEAETCNYADDDCNGALDDGVGGCRIGVHRSFNSSTVEHFYTTSLAEAMTPGFNVEAQDYYFVYANEHSGLIAFYRCLKGNGKHFYTASSTCEGQTVEGVLGYVSANEAPEAGPLYRLYHGPTGNHFYTTSAAERDSAVGLGYTYESIACYVF